MHHFVAAYRSLKIRPPNDDPHPERTNADFCVYDEPSGTYRYKPALVKRLIKKCQTVQGFENATGYVAEPTAAKPSER